MPDFLHEFYDHHLLVVRVLVLVLVLVLFVVVVMHVNHPLFFFSSLLLSDLVPQVWLIPYPKKLLSLYIVSLHVPSSRFFFSVHRFLPFLYLETLFYRLDLFVFQLISVLIVLFLLALYDTVMTLCCIQL